MVLGPLYRLPHVCSIPFQTKAKRLLPGPVVHRIVRLSPACRRGHTEMKICIPELIDNYFKGNNCKGLRGCQGFVEFTVVPPAAVMVHSYPLRGSND